MILSESLKRLSEQELDELIMIPVWITLLVAGADNKYSKAEINRAIRIIDDKEKGGGELLASYYNQVRLKFELNVKGYLLLLPTDESLRNDFIVGKIGRVNQLFNKIQRDHAISLYWSFRDLANEIAKAAGGLFGLLSVSFSETKYTDLKMIKNPAES